MKGKDAQTINAFQARLQTLFVMFSGHVFSKKKQWGLYDTLTFGIPRAIEAFCLGDWCVPQQKLKLACMIMTLPLWVALRILRYGFALVCTIMVLPFISMECFREKPIVTLQSEQDELLLDENPCQDSMEFSNESYRQCLEKFDNYYKKLEIDFAKTPKTKNPQWQNKTVKHHKKALDAAKEMDCFFQKHITNQEMTYYVKFNNLSPHGKYSIQSISDIKK